MRWNRTLLSQAASVALLSASAFAQTTLVHRQKYAMGTVFEIATYDASPDRASAILDEALKEAVRLDRIMSNFQPDSELSFLNQSAYSQRQAVSKDLYRVIEISVDYSQRSNGVFDITVAQLVNYWKAVMRGERAASGSDETALRACVGYKNVILMPPNLVSFQCPSTQIDLGAIGKGYAVDRIVDSLRRHGIANALVNAGGSTLYGLGHPPGETAWRVKLKDVSGENEILLEDDSVSTSQQSPKSLVGDRRSGHIIDPETGEPVNVAGSVSALADTATDSDALSTTALLLGPIKAKAVIDDLPNAAAVWLPATGEMKIVSHTQRNWITHETKSLAPLQRKAQK
jgi:FAD:protein FMN transferase